MLIDARDVPGGTILEADICIVGAGAAGLTLARQLKGRGLTVLLMESGGFDADADTQALMAGELTGETMGFFGTEPGLDFMRLRYFGGTTNHWGGWCHPLDAEDFGGRDHLPGSGWPFSYDHLVPHYETAQEICQLAPFHYDTDWWSNASDATGKPVLQTEILATTVMQLSPPTRFGEVYRDDVVDADDVTVCIWANVVDLAMDGDRVTSAEVAVLEGNGFTVEAGRFVVATGGIEVARLLLACDQDRPAGIGNQHDLVGRHFADHPHLDGQVVVNLPADDLTLYGPTYHESVPTSAGVALTYGVIVPSPDVLEAHDLLGLCAALQLGQHADAGDSTGDDVAELAGPVDNGLPGTAAVLSLRFEQRPNPDSRVRLTRDLDQVGMPRVEVDWRVSSEDRTRFARAVDLVADEFGAHGLGRIQTVVAGDHLADRPFDVGFHHMGTTRMADDARNGVVDTDCRVHGTDNLYVAGSAVFPSYGWANPTLTIVALAARLADHLAETDR